MPRITALHMLRSIISTISAPEVSSFRGSLPHPTQPLCTLRVRRRRRLTQHSLPGGSLGLTWAGLAPADHASFAWRLPLFDHLVSDWEQRRRHGQAEHPGSHGVDDQLEFARLYDRQVRRLLAFENPSHVDNYQAIHIHIRQAVAVSHQATVSSECGPVTDRRYPVARCQLEELVASRTHGRWRLFDLDQPPILNLVSPSPVCVVPVAIRALRSRKVQRSAGQYDHLAC